MANQGIWKTISWYQLLDVYFVRRLWKNQNFPNQIIKDEPLNRINKK